MAAVLAELNAYLDREGVDPAADRVGYRQGVLHLSPDELTTRTVIEGIRTVVGNEPTPERRPHPMTAIFFPADAEAPATRP